MRAALVSLLVVFLSACAADPNRDAAVSDPGKAPAADPSTDAKPMIEYHGPEVTCELNGAQLKVDIRCPTGGHALAVGRTRREGDHTRVELTLTRPGDDEAVTQAFETKTQRVALPDEKGPVYVYIQTVKRGVHFIVAPEHKLAAILER